MTTHLYLRFVISSHIRHHPSKTKVSTGDENINDLSIPQEMLKKYLVYARENIHPKLQNINQDKIAKIYSQLRQESLVSMKGPCSYTSKKYIFSIYKYF